MHTHTRTCSHNHSLSYKHTHTHTLAHMHADTHTHILISGLKQNIFPSLLLFFYREHADLWKVDQTLSWKQSHISVSLCLTRRAVCDVVFGPGQ